MNNGDIKTTCLHDCHTALGAQMSPFAGFDMPIQYEGIAEEHLAVRNACGIFDVSHMGEVTVTGPEAEKFVNHIFTNDVTNAPDFKIFYGMMLHANGGTIDDLLVYKRCDNNFLLVINAANIDKDVAHIMEQAKNYDVEVKNISDPTGEIAIQGPDSEKVMLEALGLDCKDLVFYTFMETTLPLNGAPVLVSRTGYTGEDGFEIYSDTATTRLCWNKLMESGLVKPCGLGCRDTLRFEVGLPLYGDELTDEITPLEASLGIFVKLDKPEFIGREALAAQKEAGVSRKLVGLEIKDRAIARHGAEVILPATGEVIGAVTTGYRGISVDKSIAMALIDSRYAALGTELQVKVRRKVFPAVVTAKKFYNKSYKK
ncbi:MAG: glycine cleavage system aminomethyltransferase GcvT [Paramuribaculum sp.]|nr:glycine cleavage system aminomethyltransferase GcvT [Paramuribaculum sp.]